MFSLFDRIFFRGVKKFQFFIVDAEDEVPSNRWYKRRHWESPNVLRMQGEYRKGWRSLLTDEPVAGVTFDDRESYFLLLGDRPDFRVYLEREPYNPHDPNAIKVMGMATVWGRLRAEQLGYLKKETAEALKDIQDIDAEPSTVYLPYQDHMYGLRITILIKSESYNGAFRKMVENRRGEESPKYQCSLGEERKQENLRLTVKIIALMAILCIGLLFYGSLSGEGKSDSPVGEKTESSVVPVALVKAPSNLSTPTAKPWTQVGPWRGDGNQNEVTAAEQGRVKQPTRKVAKDVDVNDPNLLLPRGVFERFEVTNMGRIAKVYTGEAWPALTFNEKQNAAASVLKFYNAKDKNTGLLIIVDGGTTERLGTMSIRYPTLKLK